MFNDTHTIDEPLHQLTQHRLVVGAARHLWCGVEGHRLLDLEVHRPADAAHFASKTALGDLFNLPEGHWASDHRREEAHKAPGREGDAVVGPACEPTPRLTEDRLGVRTTANEARDARGLLEWGADATLVGLDVSPDLRVDRIAEAKALDFELLDELGLKFVIGTVDKADRFEQGQGDERIDGGGHLMDAGDGTGTVGKVNG